MPERLLRGALGAALFLLLAGCSEQVSGSVGCPQLCADESAQLRDTVLTGSVVLDSTFTGFPRLGVPTSLLLVGQGDTADVRIVARFDTLPNLYRPTGASADSAVTRVDSATMIFLVDTTIARPSGSVRIEAYDVDTTANDTLTRALLPLFRPDRALGARTFAAGEIKDTLRLPISDAAVLAKITATQRLRIGLRLVNISSSSATSRLHIASPIVRYRVSADTLVAPDTLTLHSMTPTEFPSIAAGLTAFPVVASPLLPAPPNTLLAVGGLGGARTYMRFDIPSIVLDSVQVLRATLQLTQRPTRSATAASDTINLVAGAVIASPQVTDLFTASQFLASPAVFAIDTVRLVPRDSGRREVELVNLVRTWRSIGTTNSSRAIVLRSPQEGQVAGEVDFFSSEALPASVRPTLRLTYVPRRGFGLP